MSPSREPVLITGAIAAVIAVAIGFGLPVTPAQFGLIMAAVSAILALVTRSQVVSNEKSDELIKTAIKLPANTTVGQVKAEQAAKEG